MKYSSATVPTPIASETLRLSSTAAGCGVRTVPMATDSRGRMSARLSNAPVSRPAT
jgi:hypothetical protein